MRISTNQIYDTGIQGMMRNQSRLDKLQNQISSDSKILTAADDPVGAAQVLAVSQSKAVEEQYQTNQSSAKSQLSLLDLQLTSLTTALQTVRDNIVKAGNATYTPADRESVAKDLESNLAEILGIANTDNGTGDYLFSGYQGGTLPFAADGLPAKSPATASSIAYSGDGGNRALQVSASRQMAVSVAGSEVFMNGRNGNGTFVATTGGNIGGGINQGTAVIDMGSVTDTQKWSAAVNLLPNTPQTVPPVVPTLKINFSVDATTGATTYQLFDATQATAVAVSNPKPYTTGQTISFVTEAVTVPIPPLPAASPLPSGTDFGAQVVVTGAPKDGDTFTVTPSTSQSIFQTVQNMIGILRSPVASSTYSATQLANDLAGQLSNIDQAMSQVSDVLSTVGANERELDALSSTSSDLVIQYTATISDIQGLDYNQTYSDYTRQMVNLEAAQKSFVKIAGLSLFDYI